VSADPAGGASAQVEGCCECCGTGLRWRDTTKAACAAHTTAARSQQHAREPNKFAASILETLVKVHVGAIKPCDACASALVELTRGDGGRSDSALSSGDSETEDVDRSQVRGKERVCQAACWMCFAMLRFARVSVL
jgi:hypothetical protein